jgi:leucine dehydrogenase
MGGTYSTGEDVGTTPDDMAIIARRTPYVAGVPGRTGDPSPYTARGVIAALDACAEAQWGSTKLDGRVVSIQGCGAVGAPLARELAARGVRLILCDVDAGRARRLADELGGEVVPPDRIYDAPADVFAPCALGASLNESTIPRLKCSIVAGSANNQLAAPEDGMRLFKRGIRYAVDYVANAGGLLSGCREMLGWSESQLDEGLVAIGGTMREVLAVARRAEIPESEAADRLARERLAAIQTSR